MQHDRISTGGFDRSHHNFVGGSVRFTNSVRLPHVVVVTDPNVVRGAYIGNMLAHRFRFVFASLRCPFAKAFGPYLIRAAGRGLANAVKVLLFVANPSRTDRDKLSQSVPKAVGVQGKMAVQCLEHSRIRTLNVTLSRKPSAIAPCGSAGSKRLNECCDSAGPRLAPRKFYSRNERGRHLRRRQINRMTKKVKTKSAALKAR